MSNTAKVLLRLNDFQRIMVPVVEEKWDRSRVADQIHCWINEKIDPENPIQGFEYVKGWMPNISPDSPDFVIGAERPDDIKRIAKEWNYSLISDFALQLRRLEESAQKEGFSQLSEFVEASPNALRRDALGNSAWDALVDTISMVNNTFTYGGDRIIFWNGDWTMTNEGMLADIDDHPDMWVMLEVAYD